MIRLKFGEIISAKKIRQIDISHETGISRNTLSSLTNNSTDMIRLDTVDLLCSHLGITPCEFFEFYPGEITVSVEIFYIDEVMQYSVSAMISIKSKESSYKALFVGDFESYEEHDMPEKRGLRGRLEIDPSMNSKEWKNFITSELSLGLQSLIQEEMIKEVVSTFEKDHGYRSKDIKVSSFNLV